MSAFSITTGLRSVIDAVNPANWTPESREVATKVARVTLVAYVALTAVQNLPTAIAASKEYVYYNCGHGAIVNALSAFGSVFYKTWDIGKAQQASSLMYNIGSTLYEKASSHGVTNTNDFLRACLYASESFPVTYYS